MHTNKDWFTNYLIMLYYNTETQKFFNYDSDSFVPESYVLHVLQVFLWRRVYYVIKP